MSKRVSKWIQNFPGIIHLSHVSQLKITSQMTQIDQIKHLRWFLGRYVQLCSTKWYNMQAS